MRRRARLLRHAAVSAGVLFLSVLSQGKGAGSAPELVIRGDGSYENAIAWQFEASRPPDYGAFAVSFPEALESTISAVVLDLTGAPPATRSKGRDPSPSVGLDRLAGGGCSDPASPRTVFPMLSAPASKSAMTVDRTGNPPLVDVYVWDDSGNQPGTVLWTFAGFPVDLASSWPAMSRVSIPVDPPLRCVAITGSAAWAGFWGDWPDGPAAAFLGVDQDGLGASGMTRVVPELGFPSGWQDISVAWVGVTALGIGVMAEPCGQDPVLSTTWGAIKRLYNSEWRRPGRALDTRMVP